MGESVGSTEGPPGKVAMVTGAGSGIGAATAEILAEAGAWVGLLGQGRSDLQEVAARLEAKGARTLVLEADVSDAVGVERAFQEVVTRWGRLDIVVANAGINGVWAPFDEILPEEWDRTFAVNVRGAFLTLRSAIPHLRTAGGSVVVVASINGSRFFGNLGATAYASSKAAQIAMVKMAALELAPVRIRVNAVCPGSISTRIESSMERRHLEKIDQHIGHDVPLTRGKPGEARQVAELIRFLASDQASHITGTEVFIDGAESLHGG